MAEKSPKIYEADDDEENKSSMSYFSVKYCVSLDGGGTSAVNDSAVSGGGVVNDSAAGDDLVVASSVPTNQ